MNVRASTITNVSSLRRIVVRDGVVLRPLTGSDGDAILKILDADPSIRQRVGIATGLHSSQDVAHLLESEKDNLDILRYVISEGDTVVGMMNFWRAGEYFGDRADPDDYGVGYFLAPSARGRGLVTDSLSALMAAAVKRLPVRTFIAFCEADNAPSGKVLEKVGFEKTAIQWQDAEHGWTEQKYLRRVAEDESH